MELHLVLICCSRRGRDVSRGAAGWRGAPPKSVKVLVTYPACSGPSLTSGLKASHQPRNRSATGQPHLKPLAPVYRCVACACPAPQEIEQRTKSNTHKNQRSNTRQLFTTKTPFKPDAIEQPPKCLGKSLISSRYAIRTPKTFKSR